MARIHSLLPLVAAVLLSACATSRPSMSYVAPEITSADAQLLAAASVGYLADPLPPARTTLVLDPPNSAKHDALTVAMLNALRARGYGVSVVDPKRVRQRGRAYRCATSRRLLLAVSCCVSSSRVSRLQAFIRVPLTASCCRVVRPSR